MKHTITFPHAGNYYTAFNHFFQKLGYTTVVPPLSTQESLNLGVKYASGQACLPFKLTLGNIVEGLDTGDVAIVAMIGGRTGMCRLAYYGELYKKILYENGYQFELFPFKLKKEMWQTVKRHFPESKLRDFIANVYGLWLRLRMVEFIRDQALQNRPYEVKKGATTLLYNHFIKELGQADTNKKLRALKKDVVRAFDKMPKDMSRETVRIGMVGEFFLQVDHFSTMNMEVFLGENGVLLDYSINFSDFFIGSIKQVRFLDRFMPTERNKVARLAKPYINRPIGGHARESVGHTALYAKQGCEGVIHIYPFTCMPEIVASSILPKVSKDYNIPVLSLCYDEHTGFAGMQTRLEAFIDMIKSRNGK